MYSATTKVNLIINNYVPFSFVTHLLFLAVIRNFGVEQTRLMVLSDYVITIVVLFSLF